MSQSMLYDFAAGKTGPSKRNTDSTSSESTEDSIQARGKLAVASYSKC